MLLRPHPDERDVVDWVEVSDRGSRLVREAGEHRRVRVRLRAVQRRANSNAFHRVRLTTRIYLLSSTLSIYILTIVVDDHDAEHALVILHDDASENSIEVLSVIFMAIRTIFLYVQSSLTQCSPCLNAFNRLLQV